MSRFLETVVGEYNRMRARAFAGDGYEGVSVAGLAIVAADSGLVLLAQRAMDETDDPEVQETWEFPGGHLDGDEDPFVAAQREFAEEVALPLPVGTVVDGWRAGDEGQYQGFVYVVDTEFDLSAFEPNDEVQAVAWVDLADTDLNLRPEMADFDVSLLDVSGNEEKQMTEPVAAAIEDEYEPLTEPDLTMADIMVAGIPVHGVLAPEDVPTGDGRGFNAGSMTSRPGRLPFSWQKSAISGHDGSVVTGSVDRLMRKDGLIHWEGMLMPSEEAGEFAGMLAFFGRFGVSVDGDNGTVDKPKTEATGMLWFDAVRAAGLTAVAIPAFHEAYVAFGPHPDMPARTDEAMTASMVASGDLVTFDRGPGWVTNPRETKRIHDYWTKPGEEGYAKIGWGTPGDFTRAKKLIGAKIAANSPEDMRFLNQIIAQWHFDALGYWPGELGKPGNAPDTPENRRRAATHASLSEITNEGIEVVTSEDGGDWEAVLVSSVSGNRVKPPLEYFHRHESSAALVIEDPDEDGIQRTYGYAAQWGVCHVGMDGRCVEPPRTYSDDYPEFHLGRTRTEAGVVPTGVLTYGVGHRDAETILRESPDQAYFDNINNAWAAVRVGEDEIGIWFSGVVLPGVPEDHLVKIEASGQVSGEWKHGAMRACLTVNVPGFPVQQPSVSYDSDGNVLALAAAAYGGVESPCEPTPAERMAALAKIDAETRMDALRQAFNWTDVAEELVAEATDEGRVAPVGLREDGAVVYEKDGEVPGTDTIVEPYPTEAGA
jgi:8-oxo-dGTP pyrophosphatase MutT (NUDIX family)